MPRETPLIAPPVALSERNVQEAGQAQRYQRDQVEAEEHVDAGRAPDDEDEHKG